MTRWRPHSPASLADDRLRETEEGYKPQSPEQKDWERTRRGIGMTRVRQPACRRLLLQQALGGLTVRRGRVFKIDVTVEGENVVSGDLRLLIEEANVERRSVIRADSREKANENVVTWVYELGSETEDALEELHRSRSMIVRRDTAGKNTSEVELLATERDRESRHEAACLRRLAGDLAAGQVIFRGRLEDAAGSDLRATARRLLDDRLDEMYPQLSQFTASLNRDDVMHVLRTTDLGTLHAGLRDGGIGLVEATPSGLGTRHRPRPSRRAGQRGADTGVVRIRGHWRPPDVALRQAAVRRSDRGRSGTLRRGRARWHGRSGPPGSAHLRRGRPSPRSGVRHDSRIQGRRLPQPDRRQRPIDERIELAKRLELFGAALTGHSTGALAEAVRRSVNPFREATVRVTSALSGLGVVLPDPVTRTRTILDRLATEDDVEVVKTALVTWSDLTGDSKP